MLLVATESESGKISQVPYFESAPTPGAWDVCEKVWTTLRWIYSQCFVSNDRHPNYLKILVLRVIPVCRWDGITDKRLVVFDLVVLCDLLRPRETSSHIKPGSLFGTSASLAWNLFYQRLDWALFLTLKQSYKKKSATCCTTELQSVNKYWKENLQIETLTNFERRICKFDFEPGNAESQGQRQESKLVFIMALVWSVIDLF